MNQRPVPSKLVNFRIPKALLEPFDDICFLSGKTLTQVLVDLIETHISNISSHAAYGAHRLHQLVDKTGSLY